MTVPPVPPTPPNQPPPHGTPPPEGPRSGGFWHRHPKRTGALIALIALGVSALVGLLDSSGLGLFTLPFLLIPIGLVGGTLALLSARARPYATGFLLAMGISLVVLGGVCVALLSSQSSV